MTPIERARALLNKDNSNAVAVVCQLLWELDAARLALEQTSQAEQRLLTARQGLRTNPNTPFGEPSQTALEHHLVHGSGYWIVDLRCELGIAIFRTYRLAARPEVIRWADCRGEGLPIGRIRPFAFWPCDAAGNKVAWPDQNGAGP
jgi:hypothetical protein